jgi:arginine decarboxylase
MNDKQKIAPILTALADYLRLDYRSFHVPGHKGGGLVDDQLLSFWGQEMLQYDLTELPGLDDLHQPEGVIAEAQGLAAALFGAEETFFLVNGSTCGIEAGILALCRDGEEIIVPRNVHKSVVYGLVLSGAVPRYVSVEVCPETGVALGPSRDSLEEAFSLYPQARGAILVNPSYQGVAPPLKQLVDLAHSQGIPVLVDEAHGGHFCFDSRLPISGLQAGADLVVQSTHKLLGSLTQTSYLHLQGTIINRDRLKNFLEIVQTSSPSYLLLASLDGARRKMALEGEKLWKDSLDWLTEVREKINVLPGIDLLGERELMGTDFCLDPTKLNLSAQELGLSGGQLAKILRERYGIESEYADLSRVVLIVSPGNSREDLFHLVLALKEIAEEYIVCSGGEKTDWDLALPSGGSMELTPREAYNSPCSLRPLEKARDQIAARLICPYPPGIPIIFPGERITIEAIDYLLQAHQAGISIYGIDASGQIMVVKD